MFNSSMTTPGGVLAPPSATMAAAGGGLSSSSTAAAKERPPGGQDGAATGQALRCPRCDSSNTKFCYYNNYSLSQPRHFCKACKRYWTRGGTLRNVPVGGGCRKNKRMKKPPTATTSATTTSSIDTSPPFIPNSSSSTAMGAAASSDLSLLLYTLANPASDVSNIHIPCNPYNYFQQQLGGFPSNAGEDYLPGLIKGTNFGQRAPPAAAAPSPPQECSIFGSAAASLLTSTFKQQHQQQQHRVVLHNPTLPPYSGALHAPASGGDLLPLLRDVKLEDVDSHGGMMTNTSGRGLLEYWQLPPPGDHALETIAAESSIYWNVGAPAFGGAAAWPDAAASCGPSITPLI